MSTLYQISEDLLALEALLTETGGDVSDAEVEAAIVAWMAELSHDRDVKMDNYVSLMRELKAREVARMNEASRLQERAQIDAQAYDRLKDRLKEFFELHELKTVETKRFRITLANNGGKEPLSVDPDYENKPQMLPERFQKTTVEADHAKIREAVEAGEQWSFAKLLPRGKSLRIK